MIINNSSNTVSVINTLTNIVKATISVGQTPWSVTVSPDGSLVYVADGGNNDIEVINAATNAIVATIPAGINPNALAVSPDGSLIYVNNSNSVLVINTSTHAVVATIPVGSLPQAILITPDGSKVYEANYASNNVYVINTATNTVSGIIPVGVKPGGGSMSADGSKVYIANEGSNSVSVISTATNAVIATIPVGSNPWGVSVRPDGSQIYVANSGSNTISVVDALTNTVTSNISVGSSPYSFGSFFTGGKGCSTPVKYTITVNPSPVTTPTITTSLATGTISACAGTASASPDIQQITVSGSNLTGAITATAPADFEVSLAAGNGYANSITIPQTSGTVSSTVVYVRSAATAPVGTTNGKVGIKSVGVGDHTVGVTCTVNALPTVNAVADQAVNSGATTTTVNFTGTGNTFTWANDMPGIGLAASGTGDIASFTAVNTGNSPVVAKITVVPGSSGYAYVPNMASNNVSVINTATNTVETTIPVGNEPYGVAVTPDGSEVYVTNFVSGSVSVIETATNTVITTIPVGASPLGIAMSPNGSLVYVANSTDDNISVISTLTNRVISTISLPGFPAHTLSISQDGKWLYLMGPDLGAVIVVDLATNSFASAIGTDEQSNVFQIITSPVGNRVYALWGDADKLVVINSLTNTVIATIPLGYAAYGCAVSPDGSHVYVTNVSNKLVSVINTSNNRVIATIPVGLSPEGISVTPDGSSVYVANDSSNSLSIISAATNTVTNTVRVGQNPHSVGNFITTGTGCTGAPVSFTITAKPGAATITTSPATGTISACTGAASASPNIQQFTVAGGGLTGDIIATAPADFEISLAPGSGYGTSVVIAQTGGTVNNTMVYVRSAASLPDGTTTANVLLSSPGAEKKTVSVAGTVNLVMASSLMITASGNNICAGTPVTFMATPTNGGSSPVYQWLLNGSNAGTNSPTFSSSTLASGDVVTCVMTSSSACVTPANVTSNSIIMDVNADVVPSISILASQSTVCEGGQVTFTATPINGGSTPAYQWLVNGNNAGTNSTTFGGSNFTDGDIVTCVMTSNMGCAAPATATSNGIKVSITPSISPAISITASQNNICPGANVIFTATPTNGGNAPVYHWLLNGNDIGANSATFASNTLLNGDVVSCRLTSNATCLTATDATSNNVTITVNAQAVPAVSINTSANNVCAGTLITFTASPTNGGSSPVYQWLLNGNNVGTNSPTFSSSAFANGDAVSCTMTTSLACSTQASTAGSIITNIFPLPVVKAGGDKRIEKGSTVELAASASANITDITWSPVTGLDDNKLLTPRASPASTTLYTITVQTAAGCMATDSVTVTVSDGISIPNAFTPNGDGINDRWDIQNLKGYQNCAVRIFDRYGGEVYSSTGYYTAWDGTLKGRRLPTGTYYYVINLNDGTRPLSGFVALIR